MTQAQHRIRPHRRAVRRVVLAVLLLVATAVGWAAWQLSQAARDLRAAEADLRASQTALTTGEPWIDPLRRAGERARSGRDHLADPLVSAAARLPLVGAPVRSARGLAAATGLTLDEALLPLAEPLGDQPAQRLLPAAGTVDLAALAALSAPADRAAAGLVDAERAVASTPARTGVGVLDDARAELDGRLSALSGAVDGLRTAVRLGPDLLGAGTVRRYLVLSQSPSEPRGTGGLLGGYTLLEAQEGRLRVVRSGGRTELESPDVPVVDLGAEHQAHYGQNGVTRGWINANLGPHVPDLGQIAAALWQRQYGEPLDGVVLVDPQALSFLLRATGPVALTDGSTITADTVAELTLRGVYERFPDPTSQAELARNALLQDVSRSVTDALLTRDVPARTLVDGLDAALDDRRIRVWSAIPQVQAELERSPVGGTLPQGRAVGDVVVDAAGSKLGYYLSRDLRYEQGCGSASSRLSLALVNLAPADGLPAYVTPPSYRPGLPPGTNRVLATLYLPGGSDVDGVLLDGAPVARRTGTERGLVWVEVVVELLPGQGRTVVVDFAEPDSDATLQRVVQPLVQPETFAVSDCPSA